MGTQSRVKEWGMSVIDGLNDIEQIGKPRPLSGKDPKLEMITLSVEVGETPVNGFACFLVDLAQEAYQHSGTSITISMTDVYGKIISKTIKVGDL